MTVSQGDIWSVTLDPAIANEQRGVRPCLVVSTARFNALPIRQAIIVPLTSRERGLPHHVPVADHGLDRPGWAMCEGLRAVSTRRFGRRIGAADERTMGLVTEQLARWLAT